MEIDESFLMNTDFDETAQEVRESARRGRKPGRKAAEKLDKIAKLERSRQSAKECRARKKLRYQYLEDLVTEREKAVLLLRQELEKYKLWVHEIIEGNVPDGFHLLIEEMGQIKRENRS